MTMKERIATGKYYEASGMTVDKSPRSLITISY